MYKLATILSVIFGLLSIFLQNLNLSKIIIDGLWSMSVLFLIIGIFNYSHKVKINGNTK